MNGEYAVIAPSHPKYPENVRRVLPDIELYALGNLDLLGQKAIGICGSRQASAKALEYALKLGKEAAKRGLVVVSGYARGVDRQAHKGALQAGGATIAVLSEGIDYFRLVAELKPLVDFDRNFLAVSMFRPGSTWQSWRAMGRNKLIVGLSLAMFVVEAREAGGTIDAAMECMRQRKPLWAVSYMTQLPGQEGNRKLLQGSAIPLKRLGDLRKALDEAASRSPEEIRQLAFNVV